MAKISRFLIVLIGFFIVAIFLITKLSPGSPSNIPSEVANAQYVTDTPVPPPTDTPVPPACPDGICNEPQDECPADCGIVPGYVPCPGGTCVDSNGNTIEYTTYCSPSCGSGVCYDSPVCQRPDCNQGGCPDLTPHCGTPINNPCGFVECAGGGNCFSNCDGCVYPTPIPGGSCDVAGCGNCGYRNPDGSCGSNASCCASVPPTSTPPPGVPTPTPIPPVNCNTSDVSLSVVPNPQNVFSPMTFNVNGNASNQAYDGFTGGIDYSSCSGAWNSQTCNTNAIGTFTWTHSWIYCIGTACSNWCSLQVPYTILGYNISGTVWVDPNNDGNPGGTDGNDYPLPGMGPGAFSVTSTALSPPAYGPGNGQYYINNLVPGFSYIVSLNPIPGYTITSANPKSATAGFIPPNPIVDFTVTPLYTVMGHVYEDKNYNNCTDKIPYQDPLSGLGTNLTLNGPVSSGPFDSDGIPGVTFANLTSGTYSLTTTLPFGYSVYSTQGDLTKRSNSYMFPLAATGYPGWNSATNTETVNFCVSNINPWFQVSQGDIRMQKVNDSLFPGNYVSSDANSPSIVTSTASYYNFGLGHASSLCGALVPNCYTIDYEYAYNNLSQAEKGRLSYDFYKARAQQAGVTIQPLTAASGYTLSNLDLKNLNGVYEVSDPSGPVNAVITGYTHKNNNGRVVLLVKGDVTIKTPIKVSPSANNIFILAAQGSITIDPLVGTYIASPTHPLDTASTYATDVYTVTDLDGIYSAKGSFTVGTLGNSCRDGVTEDRKLNIGGTVVADSLYSFSYTRSGQFDNQRSLCINDRTYPSVKIFPRYDMITSMSDFYKENIFTWKEVQP